MDADHSRDRLWCRILYRSLWLQNILQMVLDAECSTDALRCRILYRLHWLQNFLHMVLDAEYFTDALRCIMLYKLHWLQNSLQMLLDAEYEAIERWCKGRLPTIHQLHLFSNQLLTIFPWRYSETKLLFRTFSLIEEDEMTFVDVSICFEFVSSF